MNQRDLEAAVLHALGDDAPIHAAKLAEQLGEHPAAIDQTCIRLHRSGYVQSATHGTYDITDYGQRRLDESVADAEQ